MQKAHVHVCTKKYSDKWDQYPVLSRESLIPCHRKYIALRNQRSTNAVDDRLEGSVEYRRIYNGFQSYKLRGGISVGLYNFFSLSCYDAWLKIACPKMDSTNSPQRIKHLTTSVNLPSVVANRNATFNLGQNLGYPDKVAPANMVNSVEILNLQSRVSSRVNQPVVVTGQNKLTSPREKLIL